MLMFLLLFFRHFQQYIKQFQEYMDEKSTKTSFYDGEYTIQIKLLYKFIFILFMK